MGKFIIKLHDDKLGRDWYLEWSSVVDAPVTYGMSLEEFTDYYRNEYGESGMRIEFQDRMQRVEAKGTSYHLDDLNGLLSVNRAGPQERHATIEEIIEHYCRNPPE